MRYGGRLAAWALILGCLAIAAALYLSVHCYIAVPFEDQWAVLQEFSSHPGVSVVQTLWSLHNEHRLPFAKLLMLADLYLFHGQNISLYLEIYLVQILHLLIFIFVLHRVARWPPWMALSGSGLAAFGLFWQSQFQSFLNPFGVSVLPAYVFGTAAIFALLFCLLDSEHRPLWFSACLISAFISESSLANGLLIWPLLLILAVRFRVRSILIAVLAMVASVCIAAYLIGYQSPGQHANPLDSLHRPALVLEYLSIYFGSVWADTNLSFGEVCAVFAMGTVFVCYTRELFQKNSSLFSVSLLSLCMFLLGTGILTALGRINFPLAQAASSRYQSSALLFWVCFGLYLMNVAYDRSLNLALLVTGTALLFATLTLFSLPTSIQSAEEMTNRVNTGALPVYADVKDDLEIAKLIVSPNLVFDERPFLRHHDATFYFGDPYRLLGVPLSASFQVAPPDRCFGAFDRNRKIPDPAFPGWELYGWAWDHKNRQPVDRMVAVTDNGTITGIGITGLPRPDVHSVFAEVTNPDVGWRAYIQGAADFQAVQVYGVVDAGRSACLITPAFKLPK